MSIKTTTEKEVIGLKSTSKEFVVRTCDNCEKIEIVEYRTVYQARFKRKSDKDYCLVCAREISSKNRRKKDTFETRGYQYRFDPITKKQVCVHIEKMEQELGRKMTETEVVHHIDKDKKNNGIENLVVFENQSQHQKSHQQLENIAVELYKKNIIGFDRDTKNYFLRQEQLQTLFEVSYGFEHIAIKQKKNICSSRMETDISSEIVRGITRPIPLIASNMSTVVDANFCIELDKLGAMGIMHRAKPYSEIIDDVYHMSKHCDVTAASVGIDKDEFDFAKALIHSGVDILCIDIAHGFSERVFELAKQIKKYSRDVKVIIGNTTNPEMLKEASDFADAIKVGIAQGFACETKNTAGCTEKQFSALLKFKELSKIYGIPIISDGGIREASDFTKAIAAGANSVMAGKIFAECIDSPTEIVTIGNERKKLYAGMASTYVQEKWKGGLKEGTCAEGGVRFLTIQEDVRTMLQHYTGALRSGITYAGGNDISSFQKTVEFIRLAS
jgi:IMP dehydrogenase/GMP reductase